MKPEPGLVTKSRRTHWSRPPASWLSDRGLQDWARDLASASNRTAPEVRTHNLRPPFLGTRKVGKLPAGLTKFG